MTIGEMITRLQAVVAADPAMARAPFFASHGEATRGHQTREYRIWRGLITRCLPSAENPAYSARGITVCVRWFRYINFITDMGRAPSLAHSLDRKDNDGPYSPDNCRWATKREQNRNRRNNHKLTVNGETRLLCEWVERSGLPNHTIIIKRLNRGWTPEQAIGTPALAWGQRLCP